MHNYVTTEQIAKILYTTPYTIRKYIRKGKIQAIKIGKQYLIEPKELETFIQSFTYKSQG